MDWAPTFAVVGIRKTRFGHDLSIILVYHIVYPRAYLYINSYYLTVILLPPSDSHGLSDSRLYIMLRGIHRNCLWTTTGTTNEQGTRRWVLTLHVTIFIGTKTSINFRISQFTYSRIIIRDTSRTSKRGGTMNEGIWLHPRHFTGTVSWASI